MMDVYTTIVCVVTISIVLAVTSRWAKWHNELYAKLNVVEGLIWKVRMEMATIADKHDNTKSMTGPLADCPMLTKKEWERIRALDKHDVQAAVDHLAGVEKE